MNLCSWRSLNSAISIQQIDGLVELLEDSELREAQVQQQLLEVKSYDWGAAADAVA